MRHRPLNDFAIAIANLISSVEWESDAGPDAEKLQKDSDDAEQKIFYLLFEKGYTTMEARSIAQMIVEAVRNGR